MGAGALKRRSVLGWAMAAGLAGCERPTAQPPLPPCRWVGPDPARGHRLRSADALPAPALTRRARVLVLGAGIAGLAALRRLHHDGVTDSWALELHDLSGGNSQGHTLAGMACPLGAHYLPVPGPQAEAVQALLLDLGLLSRTVRGLEPDERHLCHAPQERLFIDGAWQDGLLPSADDRPATLAQYRRFAQRVQDASVTLGFSMPTLHSPWTPGHATLDAQPFATWLAREQLTDERLLGYLDYCCRDDYGAGLAQVSAWAGLHYFASRHGFHAPGDAEAEREPVFTWPQGNAFLVQAMAEPLREHVLTGRTALRVQEVRHGVDILVWDEAAQRVERWQAERVIVALPLFVAARLLADWADPLRAALDLTARRQPHAPWLVANLHLREPLLDRLGAPPAWDSVRFTPAGTSTALGYVDAMHQNWRPHPGPTVLTMYHALPVSQRAALLSDSAAAWGAKVLAELALLHPDAPFKIEAIDLARWGHAMSIPAPGVRGADGLRALRSARGRIRFAHSDLAGYSVFEEALTLGHEAAHVAQV
jgi:predicted NAD/FAD-dependent oxidoreductase